MFGTSFKNLFFLITIRRIWTLWFRLGTVTTKSSKNCSGVPHGRGTVSGDYAGDLDKLTRAHDICFWLHLCVSLHCICIGAPRTPCLPSAIPERLAGVLSCQGMTIRLTGCGLCQYGNTNLCFTGSTSLTIRPSAYSDPKWPFQIRTCCLPVYNLFGTAACIVKP